MKKLYCIVATIVAVIFFTSAIETTPAQSRVGYKAPNFTISNGGQPFSLQHFRGEYVLLTFWSSVDPVSRLDNKSREREARLHGLKHVSVNFDRSEGVFQAITRTDGTHSTTQLFCPEAQREAIIKNWHLDEAGYCSYLIGPDGDIAAVNPGREELAQATAASNLARR